MAARADKFKTTLIIEYTIGQNDEGKDIMKKQRFSSIKIEALDDDLFQVADAFSTLLEFGIDDRVRQDDSRILMD